VAVLVFGIAAIVWPGPALLTVISLFGAFAVIDGVFAVAMSIGDIFRLQSHAWAPLLEGFAGLIAGLIAFSFPALSAVALVYLIAAWAIVTGVLEVVAALWFRQGLRGEWWPALTGLISVLFGLVLIADPRSGALAVIWTIGLFAIVGGIGMMVTGFRLRSLGRQATPSFRHHVDSQAMTQSHSHVRASATAKTRRAHREGALAERRHGTVPAKLTGDQEGRLTALRCSNPPRTEA
jgi:uncharacterized membrane protein HdeD (DUF308 family)